MSNSEPKLPSPELTLKLLSTARDVGHEARKSAGLPVPLVEVLIHLAEVVSQCEQCG